MTEAIADDIGAFAALGVSELIFDFRSESLAESLDRMESFAAAIKPNLDQLIDRVLAIPAVGAIIKPTVDAIRDQA